MLAARPSSSKTPVRAADGGQRVLRRSPESLRRLERRKRVLDVTLSATLLVLCAPVLLVAMAAVRCTSAGPALHRQRRVGRHGRCFTLLKLRSMREGPYVAVSLAGHLRAPGGVEGEDRRTAVGRLLRRTSLDELPQLINVLRGDMSLVGPRPERPEHVVLLADEIPGTRSAWRSAAA